MTFKSFRRTKTLGNEGTDIIMTERLVDVERRKMTNFTVLQLFDNNGEILEIKKHDFSHTGYNAHKFYEKRTDRTEYPEQLLTDMLYEDCKKDILKNWKEYRDRYVKKYLKN